MEFASTTLTKTVHVSDKHIIEVQLSLSLKPCDLTGRKLVKWHDPMLHLGVKGKKKKKKLHESQFHVRSLNLQLFL